MEEERVEKVLDELDDPFNPKKDKSGLIKGILWGLFAVAVIGFYIYLTT